MKANEAPEKIYVNFPFGERHPERGPMVTKQGLNAEDIEYIRADAFIEKAKNWLDEHICDYECEPMGEYPRLAMLDDFETYMKRE